MKKIIKSSLLFFTICFFTGKLQAQLSSDKPAMTAAQFDQLQKSRFHVGVKVTATASISQEPASAKLPVFDQGGVKPVLVAEVPKQPAIEPERMETRPVSEIKLQSLPAQSKTRE